MKVLHITSSIQTGAGRAAYRLHQGLQRIGLTSQVSVQFGESDERSGIVAPQGQWERLYARSVRSMNHQPVKLYPKRQPWAFMSEWFPDGNDNTVAQLRPDVINLHSIGKFLQVPTLAKFDRPLVWTLHDMSAFTGGCQYSQGCNRYTKRCGACPNLHSTRSWDLSRWMWQWKARAWQDLDLTIVTPSLWLANCAKSSSLFGGRRVEVIPYGLDTQIYQPVERRIAREKLNLSHEKQIILFGAAGIEQPRKGFRLLGSALQELGRCGWGEKAELVVFGSSESESRIDSGFQTHYLGQIHDERSLALVYAAADVMVVPSLEDNLPNTVLEALSCGTPCVAFGVGGITDMLEHQQNGYIARPFEVKDLACGIAWVLEDKERHRYLGGRARVKAEREYTLERQAQRYAFLYEQLIEREFVSAAVTG
jgi:glycosyltransferase involved in cell wall biosynthesis